MTLMILAVGAVFTIIGVWNLVDPKLRFYREVDAIDSGEASALERFVGRVLATVLLSAGLFLIYLGL